MVDVKLIGMNYENVYGYLCFCCADAVDCGAASPRCMDWMWIDMDWVVLFWMRGVGVEWRLLESGFSGLWEIFRIGRMLAHRWVCCRLTAAPVDCGSSPQ